jgi:hypothetical protein
MLDTPIVLLIFRRPELTQRVFAQIAAARPRQLFIVADGPRSEADAERCAAARAVVEQIDWDCAVQRNYASHNMGLRQRIPTGLDWVFKQVEQAIILEDDCLPHPTFFRYCTELLDRHAAHEDVMHISGDNFGYQRPPGSRDSYYFSRFAHVWGWATWRRAWAHYDVGMQSWHDSAMRQAVLSQFPRANRRYWQQIFDHTASGSIQTWDYQWLYACLVHNGKCAMPYGNLVSNIGFGGEATHTSGTASPLSNLPVQPMTFPLHHPNKISWNEAADAHTLRSVYTAGSIFGRFAAKLHRLLDFRHL